MEDFSFPAITTDDDRHVPFTGSPPWFSPSSAFTHKQTHRKSFSGGCTNSLKKDLKVVCSSPTISEEGGSLYEERMDMLWEDFNEELHCINPCTERIREHNSPAELRPDRALHRRRPSLLLMLKVLRKLFLIQRTQSARRTMQGQTT
ncbi:hypothetical protein J5N97_022330 [Dioscorea zingiberensis]|uniref:Uncharacterized protein n=1 Tax=Dioscorea zingiberensis TaxID=325984 RepID=A0A9D5HAW5_9LILI|nr:hypothetical protein J5N97_022330 [Dioscorea zingiberensis]